MEKGAMRCEVNLSLKDADRGQWGTKVEIKNLNSFRSVRNAIAYEIERQTNVLNDGGVIEQVTRGWDENRGVTFLQRTKEGDTGYRYFPEPDLPPLDLEPAWIETIKAALPELPQAKIARYVHDYGLTKKEAETLAEDRAVAEFYDKVVTAASDTSEVTPKLISNWVSGELFFLLGEHQVDVTGLKIRPEQLVTLIKLVCADTINQNAAKKVLRVMFETGRSPEELVNELGLQQISDKSQLIPLVQQILADNPDAIVQFKGGKETIINFLVGQVMRVTRGKANPQLAEQVLREQLQQ
jgi:aspartyl-tRNA(Asn)/glutamyl-tRNA(Gln) amidotransferase subunit B